MSSQRATLGIEIPSLRIKRSHKKSRLGCKTCKQRRVKCDESRPICSNCSRRGLECAYAEKPVHGPITPDSTSGETILPTSDSFSNNDSTGSSPVNHPSPISPADFGIREADLLQHYLLHTSRTFDVASLRSQSFWQSCVPALGYSSKAVRLGILTAASICLYNDVKHDAQQSLNYLQTAEYYGEQFVELSSKLLRDLEPGHADVHLTCSRLLTMLAFAFFRVHQEHMGITIVDEAAWTWLHMLRGTADVFQYYKFTDEKVTDVLASELKPEVASPDHPPDMYKLSPYLPYVERTRRERFAALYSAVAARSALLSQQQADEVTAAIQYLEQTTDTFCADEVISLMRTMCTWACRISKGFADMLVSGNLLALAIHSHWLMLVVLAEDYTWAFGNMGRCGIYEIAELCDAQPAADVERSLLEWPLQMLETVSAVAEGG